VKGTQFSFLKIYNAYLLGKGIKKKKQKNNTPRQKRWGKKKY